MLNAQDRPIPPRVDGDCKPIRVRMLPPFELDAVKHSDNDDGPGGLGDVPRQIFDAIGLPQSAQVAFLECHHDRAAAENIPAECILSIGMNHPARFVELPRDEPIHECKGELLLQS